MKIYLIRHAHYIPEESPNRYSEKDGRLSEKGILQAERLGERLVRENVRFNMICSSGATRASETAEICCKILGLEKILSSEDLAEDQRDEEPQDVMNRMKGFMDYLKSEFKEGNFGVFSHCFAIRYLLRSITGNKDLQVLPHAGIVLLDYSGSELRVEDYDSKLHLSGVESY